MNKKELIDVLLLEKKVEYTNDCIPAYLSEKYDREAAAIALGKLALDEPDVLGALCKACVTDEEEDIRITALESLVECNKKLAIAMACYLVRDENELVRDTASEIINLSGGQEKFT